VAIYKVVLSIERGNTIGAKSIANKSNLMVEQHWGLGSTGSHQLFGQK
jgi:hypothetical protein